MKRRDFIKTGAITAGGLLIPDKINGLEVKLNGRIIDILSESPVYGAKLKFYSYPGNELVYEAESDENGIYPTGVDVKYDLWKDVRKLLFDDNPEFDKLREKIIAKRSSNGFLKLEINHDNYFDAVKYVDLSQSEFNTDIIPKTFDMELFDMWCRSINGCIQRWEEQPKWYIWTDMANQEQINMVEDIIQNDLVKFTNGFISNSEIEKNKDPPNLNDLNGKIIVMWDNDPGFYDSVKINNNKIYSATVTLSTYFLNRPDYLKELTQVFGPLSERETRYFLDLETGRYLPIAKDIGNILYKRPIGSKSPDIDPEPQ